MALQVCGVDTDQLQGDKISNLWLSEPTNVGFWQRHFNAGASTFPTREFLSKGWNKDKAACRCC